MNIQPLTRHSSKDEEVRTMLKVATLFPAGTYGHDLFTEKFCSWFEERLRNDFPPELFTLYEAEQCAANVNMGKVIDLEKELIDSQEQAQKYRTWAEARLGQYREWIDAAQDTAKANEDAAIKAHNALHEAQVENERLEDEITRLKARLYDLQNR